MTQTLLIENNVKIENFYLLNLSMWLELKVITKNTLESALAHIGTESKNINLIICRCQIDGKNIIPQVQEKLKSLGLTIPIIVVGPGPSTENIFGYIPNSLQIKPLIQNCAKALNITAKQMSEKPVPDFYPIPIHYFKVTKVAICQLHTQDLDDKNKYNIKIKKNAPIDEAQINRLIQEGFSHLYVDKLDRLELAHFITSELISTLAPTEISADEEVTMAERSLELLSKKLLTMGVNEDTIALATKNLDGMKKNYKKNPKLSGLLEKLLSNKSSYIYAHTQIMIYLCLHIIKNIDWGNQEQEEKISFIAFFHDIALEKDEHAKIKSNAELKAAPFSEQEKQLIDKHAQLAAEIISKIPRTPIGADQIIRQHHGNLNGVGFSEHFGNNVTPVSMVLIVAEEMTRMLLNAPENKLNKTQIVSELRQTFSTNRFKKIIDTVETVIV